MNLDLRNRIERLSAPEPNTGCWLWTGSTNRGYGVIGVVNGCRSAHRVSYTEYVGDPGGMLVMHRCDTPSCVNPAHLALGTYRDNALDMSNKLRTKFSRASKEQRQAWAQQTTISGLKASSGLTLSERVERLSVPEPNTGCRLWAGAIANTGYGKIKMDGEMRLAHRVSYTANVGEIPDGMIVLHKCDTRACVNPDHLSVGTNSDNMVDATKKGRSRMAIASTGQRVQWAKNRLIQQAGTLSDMVRKGWETRRKNGRECTLTPEQLSERSKKTWVTRRERRVNSLARRLLFNLLASRVP